MHYPTICTHFNISLSNNSVAHLTINESFYIMTIIKPNNMTSLSTPSTKIKTWPFYIRVGFGYGYGVGTHILVTRPIPVLWNRGKPKPIPKPKPSQIGVGLDGYPWTWVLLPCLNEIVIGEIIGVLFYFFWNI